MSIVSDNNYVIGSIEHLTMLLNLAMYRTEKLGMSFIRDDYKWLLGIEVIRDLENNAYYVTSEFPDIPRTLFGIIVEPDYHNPNNVQLYENITNKLWGRQ